MDLKTETDAELISLREKLDAWCLQHQGSKWGNRLLGLIVILGVLVFLEGVTDIFFSGINSLDIFLIVLGAVTCFSWYKRDKQKKTNISLLAELNSELTRRNVTTVRDDAPRETEST